MEDRLVGAKLLGEDRLLSVDEAVACLGAKRDTIYKWIERKLMPAKKAGRLWKFKVSEADEIAANLVASVRTLKSRKERS